MTTTIVKGWAPQALPNHYVVLTEDEQYKQFAIEPLRKLAPGDLTQYTGPAIIDGREERMPIHLYNYYGLAATKTSRQRDPLHIRMTPAQETKVRAAGQASEVIRTLIDNNLPRFECDIVAYVSLHIELHLTDLGQDDAHNLIGFLTPSKPFGSDIPLLAQSPNAGYDADAPYADKMAHLWERFKDLCRAAVSTLPNISPDQALDLAQYYNAVYQCLTLQATGEDAQTAAQWDGAVHSPDGTNWWPPLQTFGILGQGTNHAAAIDRLRYYYAPGGRTLQWSDDFISSLYVQREI